MERHSDRLHALVEDVLSLARLESPAAELDLSEISLPEFLPEILRDWEKRSRRKSSRRTSMSHRICRRWRRTRAGFRRSFTIFSITR